MFNSSWSRVSVGVVNVALMAIVLFGGRGVAMGGEFADTVIPRAKINADIVKMAINAHNEMSAVVDKDGDVAVTVPLGREKGTFYISVRPISISLWKGFKLKKNATELQKLQLCNRLNDWDDMPGKAYISPNGEYLYMKANVSTMADLTPKQIIMSAFMFGGFAWPGISMKDTDNIVDEKKYQP